MKTSQALLVFHLKDEKDTFVKKNYMASLISTIGFQGVPGFVEDLNLHAVDSKGESYAKNIYEAAIKLSSIKEVSAKRSYLDSYILRTIDRAALDLLEDKLIRDDKPKCFALVLVTYDFSDPLRLKSIIAAETRVKYFVEGPIVSDEVFCNLYDAKGNLLLETPKTCGI